MVPRTRSAPPDNAMAGIDRAQEARPTFAQRLHRRRCVAFELDRLLDSYRRPDPSELYAIAPSREVALDE